MSATPAVLMICADDYGAAPSVSEGIEQLALQGRLQAVSCMVNTPDWPQAARALADWPKDISLGLHFNLTEGEPLSAEMRALWPRFPGLGSVLGRGLSHCLPRHALACEWQAQWQAFSSALEQAGRRPGHLDGHQHVHQLPGVREWVAACGLEHGLAVRHCGHLLGPGWALKRRIIELCGSRGLHRALLAQGLACNPTLTGAYDFQEPDYRRLFRQWLAALPPGGSALLFCHPGQAPRPGEPPDAISTARQRELAYLASESFLSDVVQAGVRLGSAWRRSSND